MLNKVKTALRLTTTAYDDELQDLINACKADLGLTDIYTINDDDVLIIRCVILYCKMYFGTPNDTDSKRLKQAYDELKGSMLMSSKYTDYTEQGGGDMVIDGALSTTSTNPVQNKVIAVALENVIAQITANTNSIATMNENINAVNAELTSIQDSIANVEQSITNINENITSINTEVTGVKSNITSINGSIDTLNAEVSSLKTIETIIQGWTAITPNTFETLNISQAIAEGKKRFTILIYARKGSNRQAIKYELTLSELKKLLSKATTNELTITRSCAGITNANNIALCKQSVKQVYDNGVVLEGVLEIKYQIYEGGNAVTGLDNFECCVYAE